MPSKTPKWTGKVNANSGLNVRNGAGTNYKVIKTLPKGTSVNICDTSGSWYYIKFSSSSYGYVYKTYVTKTGNVKKSVAKSALNSKNSKNNKKKPSNKSKLTKAQQLALKKKKEAELKKLQQKKKVEAYNNKIKKKSKIGNFGETIVFSVSSSKILTPHNMKRSVSARWEQHKILGKAPKSEFVGQNAPETTMTVVLSAECGVKPRAMLGTIEKAIKAGTVNWLVIGGKFVGGRKMYISSCSETWDEIWNKGELVRATVNLTFVEYT
jgi:phage protein U